LPKNYENISGGWVKLKELKRWVLKKKREKLTQWIRLREQGKCP